MYGAADNSLCSANISHAHSFVLSTYDLSIRPSIQLCGGKLSSCTITIAPTDTFGDGLVQLLRTCSSLIYSSDHRRQSCCLIAPTLRHRSKLPSSVTGFSGNARNESPMRKWPGVSAARSFGSEESGDKGREFKIASTSAVTVVSSSNVRRAFMRVRLISPLTLLTAASHKPPKWGLWEG